MTLIRTPNLLVAALVAYAAGGISCSEPPPRPPAQAAQPAPPAQPAAAPAPVAAAPSTTAITAAPVGLGSAQYSGDPDLRCDLLEVKRVSGNALLVRWRVVSTVPPGANAKNISYDYGWDALYYIDPSENKKYGYLTDHEGARILDVSWGTIRPGEQRLMWAKFPAPPASSAKISVTIPKFTPFEDVPVAP